MNRESKKLIRTKLVTRGPGRLIYGRWPTRLEVCRIPSQVCRSANQRKTSAHKNSQWPIFTADAMHVCDMNVVGHRVLDNAIHATLHEVTGFGIWGRKLNSLNGNRHTAFGRCCVANFNLGSAINTHTCARRNTRDTFRPVSIYKSAFARTHVYVMIQDPKLTIDDVRTANTPITQKFAALVRDFQSKKLTTFNERA